MSLISKTCFQEYPYEVSAKFFLNSRQPPFYPFVRRKFASVAFIGIRGETKCLSTKKHTFRSKAICHQTTKVLSTVMLCMLASQTNNFGLSREADVPVLTAQPPCGRTPIVEFRCLELFFSNQNSGRVIKSVSGSTLVIVRPLALYRSFGFGGRTDDFQPSHFLGS